LEGGAKICVSARAPGAHRKEIDKIFKKKLLTGKTGGDEATHVFGKAKKKTGTGRGISGAGAVEI